MGRFGPVCVNVNVFRVKAYIRTVVFVDSVMYILCAYEFMVVFPFLICILCTHVFGLVCLLCECI